MRLTDQQERLIARYLREAGEHMAELPDRARERALDTMREEILDAIPPSTSAVPDDAEVELALRMAGPPARHAERFSAPNRHDQPSRQDTPAPAEETGERRWLGVCAAMSEQTGAPVGLVRWGTVLLGVVTGPFALIAYIGVFLALYFSERADTPPIDKWRIAKYVAGLVLGAVVLRVLARGFLVLLHYGYGLLVQEELRLAGLWNWLERNDGSLFFWTLFCLIPVAVLAALPVPAPWRNTLRKVFEAGLALYALALSFGVGCALAGAILQASQYIQDPTTFDFQSIFSAI